MIELDSHPVCEDACTVLPSRENIQSADSTTCCGSLLDATETRRKRGPALSRRTGQTGSVFQHSKPWNPTAPAYGRYWIDVPGCDRKRRTVTLGVCTSRSVARRKLREHIEREGINTPQYFNANTGPVTTFRAQALKWIAPYPCGGASL
jgi:hypothetical protein